MGHWHGGVLKLTGEHLTLHHLLVSLASMNFLCWGHFFVHLQQLALAGARIHLVELLTATPKTNSLYKAQHYR